MSVHGAPEKTGPKGQGFRCDKEGINKMVEVLRTERRKTYGRADNDIVGGGGQKMKGQLKRGEWRVGGGGVWFRLLWIVGPGRRIAAPGGTGGKVWNNLVSLSGPAVPVDRRRVRLGRSEFPPLTVTHERV